MVFFDKMIGQCNQRGKYMSQIEKNKKAIVALLIVLTILVISFIGVGVFAIKNRKPIDTENIETIIESNVLKEGITIADIDVSLMDESQARAAVKPVVDGWYKDKDIAFTVNRQGFLFNVEKFGAKPDVDKAIKQAFLYSATEELPQGVFPAADGSVDFVLSPKVDLSDVSSFLQSETIASQINIAPNDAGIIFRSQVNDETQRFEYQEPVAGIKVNIEEFAVNIVEVIEDDNYSVMEAPVEPVSSFTSIEDMKENTQLIGSYTSKITIKGENRVKNIQRMAQILCEGMPKIMPTDTLSLNGVAGMRTQANGFFEAPGLTSGVHDLQYGGGVCQISSTVYIAALKAELEITERNHHSLPSEYIPIGLDATISETPDLKITNNKTYPVYMSIVVDKEKWTVTCSFYGKPAAHGFDVDIVGKLVKTSIPAPPTYKYSAKTPGGSDIKPGQIYTHVAHTYGQRVKVYRQYKDSEGNVVNSENLYDDRYDAFSGVYYLNPNENED
jgi:vancomycin resistance protein YoaR